MSALLASLQSIGAEIRVPREHPFDASALLHDQDYLDFHRWPRS
ncbi:MULTISPECIES: hypothetical protein [unclassified Mesorhizobium]